VDVKTGQAHTPQRDGFEATLTFVATDSSHGTFTYTRAGGTPIVGTFGIAYEHFPGSDFIGVDPGFDFLTRNAWVGAGPDSMSLGGVFELGYNSTYARVRK
jgi:hypothetical protein